jgi:hypothetical protein
MLGAASAAAWAPVPSGVLSNAASANPKATLPRQWLIRITVCMVDPPLTEHGETIHSGFRCNSRGVSA